MLPLGIAMVELIGALGSVVVVVVVVLISVDADAAGMVGSVVVVLGIA